MQKCLLCGAVFEDGVTVCPVCGAGPDQFVPVESGKAAPPRADSAERFLILGGGIAGLRAAEAIRTRNRTAGIVLVSDEPVSPYRRPMLTKSLPGAAVDEHLAVHDADWYALQKIYLVLGRTVRALDPARREVTLDDGTCFSYSKCIYALGAECFLPPLPGSDLPGVFTVRRLADAASLARALPGAANAVVIGGGVLGLEAAWALRRAGLVVTVVEAADRFMGRQLDPASAGFLRSLVEAQGVPTRLSASVTGLTGRERVTGVSLADGTRLPADLVVFSCGVRANSKIAAEAGLAVGRGVKVDAGMRTSEENIFACGDCAELDGTGCGLWNEAAAMGETAGANAAGDARSFTPGSNPLSFTGFGTSVFVLGDPAAPTEDVTVEEQRDPAAGTLRRLAYRNAALCGITLIGDLTDLDALTKKMSATPTSKK